MEIMFACPVCQRTVRDTLPTQWVDGESHSIRCPGCERERVVCAADLVEGNPSRCLVCHCDDLWRQKDFPVRIGLSMVAVGIVLSTIAWAQMRPIWAIGILMGFALLDWLLYTLMSDVLVCYRCAARHRGVNRQPGDLQFDHELMERYRQEKKRLNDSASTSSV